MNVIPLLHTLYYAVIQVRNTTVTKTIHIKLEGFVFKYHNYAKDTCPHFPG